MTKEFNLSEKEIDLKGVKDVIYQGVYFRKEVKEFIKILKDPDSEVNPTHFCEETGVFRLSDWWKELDKLAGDNLI